MAALVEEARAGTIQRLIEGEGKVADGVGAMEGCFSGGLGGAGVPEGVEEGEIEEGGTWGGGAEEGVAEEGLGRHAMRGVERAWA